MNKNFVCLKGDKTSEIYRDWKPWLNHTSKLYMKFIDDHGHWPLHDNEQAAVSLLLAGAVKAGYLALAECEVDKDERKGRGDLWIICDNTKYWFEFKRAAFNPNALNWGLKHALYVATNDINKLAIDNGELGVAGVIAATDLMKAGRKKTYSDFCDHVDYAFHIGPSGARGAYLYFSVMPEPNITPENL